MGKRLAIVAVVIVLAGVLVLAFSRTRAPIAVRVLGLTNIAGTTLRLVEISNTTSEVYAVRTWTERQNPEGKWEKAHLGGGNDAVSPKSTIILYTLITSRHSHRFVVLYHADGGWREWIRHLRTLMGMKPLPEENGLHVEVGGGD
jgi:hypothetical protein